MEEPGIGHHLQILEMVPPVPQLQPRFAPSEGDGESSPGRSRVPARDGHPCEGRNVTPRPQKVGKRDLRSLSPPSPCRQSSCGWVQPCLRVLFSPEKALGLGKITSPNRRCSFTTGRSCKKQVGTACVAEGKCGESRENPREGGLCQPGKQLHQAFGMFFLQLRGWRASRAQWRRHSPGNHLPSPSSTP